MAGKGLKEVMAGMTGKEKLEYLWTYYKWILGVAVIAIVVIAMVATGISNRLVDVLYGGAAVNLKLTDEGTAYLTDDWQVQLGGEKKQEVTLFQAWFRDLQGSHDQMDSTIAVRVTAMVAAQELDYILMDEAGLAYYKNQTVFPPMGELFDPQTLAQWDSRLVYHETQEQGKYPIAVDISDTAFVKDCMPDAQKVYIAFPGNTGRAADDAAFLEYLLNWQKA